MLSIVDFFMGECFFLRFLVMFVVTSVLRLKDIMRLYGVSENTALKIKRSILSEVRGSVGCGRSLCVYHVASYEGVPLDVLLSCLNGGLKDRKIPQNTANTSKYRKR